MLSFSHTAKLLTAAAAAATPIFATQKKHQDILESHLDPNRFHLYVLPKCKLAL